MHMLFNWTIFVFFGFLPLWGQTQDVLQEARTQYQRGEKATTYEERKTAFNQALFLYHSLEQQESSVSNLDEALANTYFQLGEYAWAILYDERALKKNGPNVSLLSDLEMTQKKLGVFTPPPQKNWISSLTFFPQYYQWIFWIILLAFITFSASIWFPLRWIRKLAAGFAVLVLLFLGHVLFVYYFTPIEGIVVKTTGLYREPNWHQPQITNQPLLAGSKVKVLQMTENEEWLKIENSSGLIGYIPTVRLRAI